LKWQKKGADFHSYLVPVKGTKLGLLNGGKEKMRKSGGRWGELGVIHQGQKKERKVRNGGGKVQPTGGGRKTNGGKYRRTQHVT